MEHGEGSSHGTGEGSFLGAGDGSLQGVSQGMFVVIKLWYLCMLVCIKYFSC